VSSALLTFTDVSFAPAGAATTLSGLSFAVDHGEFLAVLGADSAARNSLALLAAGLARPDRGEVVFSPRGSVANGAIRAGLVFSVPGQSLLATTVLEEVRIGLEWQARGETEIATLTEAILRRFGLWEYRHQSPATLSGGEKQRLAIAAALALEPASLVLDEPTAMLDSSAAAVVREAAREATRDGRGLLWLTGDPADVLTADRVAILAGGTIVWTGPPGELGSLGRDFRGWGLRPLPVTALAEALVRLGLPLSTSAMTPEALGEEICSVWRV